MTDYMIKVKNTYNRTVFYLGKKLEPNEEMDVDSRLWLVRHWLAMGVVKEVSGKSKKPKPKKKDKVVEEKPVELMAEPETKDINKDGE